MISIVICSVNPLYMAQVNKSLEETLGLPFEILSWDNRNQSAGICSVYNRMASQAKYDYILFLHEDVEFSKAGWGNEIIGIFEQNQDVGLIGVAGSSYFSNFYSGWYTGHSELDFFSVIHRTNGKEIQLKSTSSESNQKEVICLDGVFLFSKKSVWERVRFNEKLLKGFHFYDIDFSLRAAKICKVLVYSEVPLVHITQGGDYGNKWVIEAILFHKDKNANQGDYNSFRLSELDKSIVLKWLDLLKNQKITMVNRLKWIEFQKLYKYPVLYFGLLKFLFYRNSGIGWIHQSLKKIKNN